MMRTTTHDEFDELLALHAIGALDGDDVGRLEAHLATGCAGCAGELAEFERAGALLAWTPAPVTPPAALRERLLDSLEVRPATQRGPIPFQPRTQSQAPRSRPAAVAAAVFLVAAAAIAIVFLTTALIAAQSKLDDAVRQIADSRSRERDKDAKIEKQDRMLGVVADPGVRIVPLSASATAEAGVSVAWNAKEQRGLLVARNLPKVAADRAYELWLIADGKPVPAAVFNTDGEGNAVVETDHLPAASPQMFAITEEPAGGSKAPTTKPILTGAYRA
jgi:anti-sigma-K factor RskA